jgi:hypothetical protein
MDAIPCFNYAGTPLATKYEWMQTGPGGQAAIGMGGALAQFAADLGQTDANIGQHLGRLGGVWQGRAAQAATGAVTRAAASVTSRAQPGTTGHQSSQRYGDSFITTKNAIPKPPPVTAACGFGGMLADGAGWVLNKEFGSNFGVQSDFTTQLAAYRAADQAANHALLTHENASRDAITAYDAAITGQASATIHGHAEAGPGTPGHGRPGTGTGAGGGAGAGGGSAAGAAGAGPTGGAGAGGPGAGGAAASGSGAGGAGTRGSGSGAGGAGAGGSGARAGGLGSGGAGGGQSSGGLHSAPPTTAPAEWTPLTPRTGGGTGAGSVVPGPNGGLVPSMPDYHPPASSTPSIPALPPFGGGLDSTGPHGGGLGGSAGAHPLAGRGDPGLPAEEARPGAGGGVVGGGAGERAGGPGGMPMGGMGGAGTRGQDKDHRNNIFIPDDEPFRVEFDDLTDSVIGSDDHRPDSDGHRRGWGGR